MVKTKPRQDGNLTYGQKAEMIREVQAKRITKEDLPKWIKTRFNASNVPHRTTIDRILKRPEKYLSLSPQDESIRRTRSILNPVVESALVNWILQMQHRRICISDELIKEKAKTFARILNIPNDQCPNFSNSWLHAFKQRNGFKRYRSHGEW